MLETENLEIKSAFSQKFDKMNAVFILYQNGLNQLANFSSENLKNTFLNSILEKNTSLEEEIELLKSELITEKNEKESVVIQLANLTDKVLANSENFKKKFDLFLENSIQPQLFEKIQELNEELRLKDNKIKAQQEEIKDLKRIMEENLTQTDEREELRPPKDQNIFQTTKKSKKEDGIASNFNSFEKNVIKNESENKTTENQKNRQANSVLHKKSEKLDQIRNVINRAKFTVPKVEKLYPEINNERITSDLLNKISFKN